MKDFAQKLRIANELNDKALQMWHDNESFDGQVVFHMELFSDWYADADPLEIVNSLSPGFNPKKPHLLISSGNIARSLDDEEFINHIFKISHVIINEYNKFKK